MAIEEVSKKLCYIKNIIIELILEVSVEAR